MLSEFGNAHLLHSSTVPSRQFSSALNGSVPGHVKPFISANLIHGRRSLQCSLSVLCGIIYIL